MQEMFTVSFILNFFTIVKNYPGVQIMERKKESLWIRDLEAEFEGLNRRKGNYFIVIFTIYPLKNS